MGSVGLTSLVVVAFLFALALLLHDARRGRETRRVERALREREAALRLSHLENRALAGRLIVEQEEERRRIARDLHDDLSQKLALLSIEIDQLAANSPIEPRRQEGTFRRLSEFVAEIAGDVHDLSHELHPSKIETLGLVAALESLCRDISQKYEIAVDFRHAGDRPPIDADAALHLYRIAQEALHNVVKHSGAKEAQVELESQPGLVELRVADHGCGFVTGEQTENGLGLVSMRERVRVVGGQLAIHSTPGLGTRVGVRLPLVPGRDATGSTHAAAASSREIA